MTREEILAKRTVKSESVEVPEWEGAYTVRGLTAVERVKFFDNPEIEGTAKENPARLGVLLLIACLRDAAGQPVFLPTDAGDIEQMDGGLVNRLCAVANRVNGLDAATKDAAEKK